MLAVDAGSTFRNGIGGPGYMVSGEENLTERFNVNNKEQNKKRFLEANSNIFKNKQSGLNKAKGAKFHNQELDFNLTP